MLQPGQEGGKGCPQYSAYTLHGRPLDDLTALPSSTRRPNLRNEYINLVTGWYDNLLHC